MTSNPDATPTTPDDSTTPYDPATDPDTDPEMLNPRTGSAAADDGSDGADGDPDGDPEQLNPRD